MENGEIPTGGERPQKDIVKGSKVHEFKARVREMNETAAEVSRGLGLPGEAQGTVLRSLFGNRRPEAPTRKKPAEQRSE